MADYTYIPTYGVEPFSDVAGVGAAAPYGGGAVVTNQNFLVSLWDVTAQDGVVPTAGRLYRPLPNTVAAAAASASIPGLGEVGLKPCFNSRTSARFSFSFLASDTQEGYPILAILNPPQDYKSQLANAARAVLDASNPFGVLTTILKPITQLSAFEVYATTGSTLRTVEGVAGLPGSPYLPFGFGLCKTSGANGVFPAFYPALIGAAANPSAFLSAIQQIDAGNFFLPMRISFAPDVEPGQARIITINWPHSSARG